jgi:histidyl-tRNA synthetase
MDSANQDPNLNTSILPGMVDASPEMHHAKLNLTASISSILTKYGYDIFDCPIIESTELYAMKSGGELTSRLYSFVEPGGMSVSLRPEFTSSVIRFYVSNEAIYKKPVKKQYVGPVFRYSDSNQGLNQRQFTQQGCEIIGDSSIDSDVEILKLSLLALAESGLAKVTIKLGHMGYIRSILEDFDLSEALIGFTFSNLQVLSKNEGGIAGLTEMASGIGLINPGDNHHDTENIKSAEISTHSLGRRRLEQIDKRSQRKKSHSFSIEKYSEALERLSIFLRAFSGDLNNISNNLTADPIYKDATEYFNFVIKESANVTGMEVDFIVDCAAQRGFTYYTGIIFDMEYVLDKKSIPLGGGGRYDGLVKLLGGPEEIPATGFAVNVDSILSITTADEQK